MTTFVLIASRDVDMDRSFKSVLFNRPFGLILVFRCFLIIALAVLLFVGCAARKGLNDFTSDGCSLFPDRSLILKQDWSACCLEHDIAYWKGGTEAQRLSADTALKACVFENTGDEALSETVFNGVRLGGSPYFYNWYRWGYGWPFERKYAPLTPEEEADAQRKLEKFFLETPSPVCR
jgi:hypothetical protein